MKSFLFVVALGFISACSTVASSTHYTRGTQALELGDYAVAISELEEAVRLDPQLSRNRNNLAAAYLQAGRIEDAWVHGRMAVILDPGNEYAQLNWAQIFSAMRDHVGLEQGDRDIDIREKLGEPDGIHYAQDQECGCIWWQYGFTALSIVNAKLTGAGDMVYRRR